MDAALDVEGVGQFDDDHEGLEPKVSDLSRQILSALVEDHEVRRNADGLLCFRLRKRHLGSGAR